MALSASERALLAERLLASLESATEADVDAAWAQEAERRIVAYRRGELSAIDGDEFLSTLPGAE